MEWENRNGVGEQEWNRITGMERENGNGNGITGMGEQE